MPINYASLAKTVTRLLKADGIPVALRRVTPGVYDPAAGVPTGDTTAVLPTVGVWVAQTADYQVTGRGVGGVVRVSDILSSDRTMVLDGSVAPQLNDKLIVPGSVTSPLVMSPDPDFPDALEGVDYTETITGSGGTLPYVWTAVGVPSWATVAVSVDTTTWTISGTPPMNEEMDAVVLTLTDGEPWQILSIVIIKPALIPIAYRCVVRK
jgi:hypothetical protein